MKKFILIITTILSTHSFSADLFKTISIDELDSLIKSSSKNIFIYDVNVESTRTNVGTIPGAKLIDSSAQYNVALILPKEKKSPLIFYCANTMCTSSHQAAARAMEAGYSDVSVLKDGIYGWKKAGKQIVSVNRVAQSVETTDATPIDPKEVYALLKKDAAVIVDVREAEERHEVVDDALWMPMSKASDSQFWNGFKKQLPKNKTIIFYCAAGFRSKKMAEKLSSEGFKSLYFKGVDQWKEAGLPVIKGPAK